MTILGIAGSLRKGSLNRKLLASAAAASPDGVTMEIAEFADIPVFDQDLETPLPPSVAAFKERLKVADAVLIATPEYNYGIPGPLKNLIDWASRPFGENVWEGKTVAMMGASPGALGTVRAQTQLRQVLHGVGARCVASPEVYVGTADAKFDADGNLTDGRTKEMVRALIEALVVEARR
ncbi:NAD(P)H-dependent oxidoreductase [Candidatus Uhrbacteria bacterium]|nr:NAD(P)H-dependent oxidoreductase [Candidatus Uhrbacteria bacterium]